MFWTVFVAMVGIVVTQVLDPVVARSDMAPDQAALEKELPVTQQNVDNPTEEASCEICSIAEDVIREQKVIAQPRRMTPWWQRWADAKN